MSTTEVEKKFGEYEVTLDTDMDGEGTTGCWIQYKQFSSSLEVLLATAKLDDHDTGNEHEVSQSRINEIEKWANENGY